MNVNTPGGSLTERVDRRTVLPVRVATSVEQRKIEDMPGGWVGDKVGVAVEPNKKNKEGEL
jgi:hypothetical protein